MFKQKIITILKKAVIISVITALLASCSSNETDYAVKGSKSPNVELRILSDILMQAEGATRAHDTSWDPDDNIGIFVNTHGSTTLFVDKEGNIGRNLKYTFYDGTNYETSGSTYRMFKPDADSRIYLNESYIDVYGYYPYNSTVTDMTSIPIDVSDQTSQSAIDFMRADPATEKNNNFPYIQMLFKHKLVKLIFNLIQGTDLITDELSNASNLNLTISNQNTQATYNIYDDILAIPTQTPLTLQAAPNSTLVFEAIVLPSNTTHTVTITFGTTANTFDITTELIAGHKYTYNVTVNATSVMVDTENKYTEQW